MAAANLPRITIHGFSPFDIAKRLGPTPEMVNNIYGYWYKDSQNKMVNYLNTI